MATDYGDKEVKSKTQPEDGDGFGKPDQTMKGPPKATNHSEHNEMMHKMMPKGYKGDCGY